MSGGLVLFNLVGGPLHGGVRQVAVERTDTVIQLLLDWDDPLTLNEQSYAVYQKDYGVLLHQEKDGKLFGCLYYQGIARRDSSGHWQAPQI